MRKKKIRHIIINEKESNKKEEKKNKSNKYTEWEIASITLHIYVKHAKHYSYVDNIYSVIFSISFFFLFLLSLFFISTLLFYFSPYRRIVSVRSLYSVSNDMKMIKNREHKKRKRKLKIK